MRRGSPGAPLKLHEWTAKMKAEYEAAGFVIENFQGLPMVQHPKSLADKIRFLEFYPSLPVHRSLYKQGVLLLPPELAKETRLK
jgi:hypothetical protein